MDQPGGRRQRRRQVTQRPEAGQRGIRESDETDGIGSIGRDGVLLRPVQGRLGGQTTHLDVALGSAEDLLGRDPQVVQPPRGSGIEGGRGLADDPAHLVSGESAVAHQVDDGLGVREGFLDDPGRRPFLADVEDPHATRDVETGGHPCRVENGGCAAVTGRQDEQGDGAAEDRLTGGPPLGTGALPHQGADGVSAREHRTGSNALH